MPSCVTNRARPTVDPCSVRLNGQGSDRAATDPDASDGPAAWPSCSVGCPCRPPRPSTQIRYLTCESSAKHFCQRPEEDEAHEHESFDDWCGGWRCAACCVGL